MPEEKKMNAPAAQDAQNEAKNAQNGAPEGNMPPKGKPKANLAVLGRVFKMLVKAYPKLVPLTAVCIIFCSLCAVMPAIFQQQTIAKIEEEITLEKVESVLTARGSSAVEISAEAAAIAEYADANGSVMPDGTDLTKEKITLGDEALKDHWTAASKKIIPVVCILIGFYIASICLATLYRQLIAIITQGFLTKVRQQMFDKMQNLPIRYFDTHKHGDIMSVYTNDTDALRELISQAFPQLLTSGMIVLGVFCIMLYYSIWLALIVILGVLAMLAVSKKLGGGSAKYFMRAQRSMGKTEGYIQEMMNGQKVVKVFTHEKACIQDFEKINDELCNDSYKAHAYANTLGPVIMNIGNLLYVITAVIGASLLLIRTPNPSVQNLISGTGMGILTIDIVVPFLNMTKQFTGNVNQLAQQVNTIAMASAGAKRIFEIMDETPEVDDGYVTLVNCNIAEDGTVTETDKHTGHWAWKHPHQADGTVTYTELKGDVRMVNVDFEYNPGKQVLYDVSVYAEPGQKVAFVGATGAGKTTITNLINRYYDIADGKIRYDGININKIKKSDLRRSLGIVLQDTNLFTGTVMENIRYGKLDATDEECIRAAKLAGADDFITRLPGGYNTELSNNGANLSQGQRQLIAIARCAVADPPVMILDEATSSIDTRTEAIVQKGMDSLMEGRTNFVIAHRLSTVRNSDVIMVLDHGHIIERGNHDKLIAEKGTYYRLYTGAFELE